MMKRKPGETMDKRSWGSILAGVGLMYLFDPERGRRRRALVRDKFARGLDTAKDAAGVTGRDLRNRARGVVAQARALTDREPVSDEVLTERVRSQLGRVVSHPGAIEVTVTRGVVTLTGPVLSREVDDLLSSVSKVRGVEDVENRLEVHDRSGAVPGLQGGGPRPEHRFEFAQENWSPTARLLAGAAGGGLAAYAVRKRGVSGTAFGVIGAGLLARAITNLKLERLLGLGPGRRGIDVRKTIRVDAPVDRVFDYWKDVSNFPFFLSHVREVRDNGRGCSHWKVAGPAGIPVEWDAVITALVPNQLLAWKTVPGEAVRHAGVVVFDEDPQGGTRVHLRMTYKPPAGVIGHAVASLLGADPKQALDDDLVRFKSIIETGKTTAHGEEVVAVELTEPGLSTRGPESVTERDEIGEPAGEESARRPKKRSATPPDRPSRPRAET
jgi:uncharacterized membrane protein